MHNQFLLPINFKLYIIIKKSNINVYVFVLIFILFNECKYIYFLDILYNKDIIVNLYKLHFPSSHFSLQLNKKVFHPLTFSPLQPNTQEGKPNIFYPFTFPSSHNFLSHSSNQTNSQGLKGILVKYHLIKRVRQIKQVLCDKY